MNIDDRCPLTVCGWPRMHIALLPMNEMEEQTMAKAEKTPVFYNTIPSAHLIQTSGHPD